jgi:hypothetical protein
LLRLVPGTANCSIMLSRTRSSNFTVQDHILSTAVDALSRILLKERRKTKEQILFVVVQ